MNIAERARKIAQLKRLIEEIQEEVLDLEALNRQAIADERKSLPRGYILAKIVGVSHQGWFNRNKNHPSIGDFVVVPEFVGERVKVAVYHKEWGAVYAADLYEAVLPLKTWGKTPVEAVTAFLEQEGTIP